MSIAKLAIPLLVVLLVVAASVYWPHADAGPSVAELRSLARSGPADQRETAVVKLARAGGPGLQEVERLLLEKPEPAIRAVCVRVLGDVYHFEAMEAILNSLGDDDEQVCKEAETAVARLMGAEIHISPERSDDPVAAAKLRQSMYRTGWENLKRSPQFDAYRKRIRAQMGAYR